MEFTAKDLEQAFDKERLEHLIEEFARIGKDETGGITRLAFSQEDLEARKRFLEILNTEFKFKVRIDQLGNIFARREGNRPSWPVIMTGSHLDTVRNGGKFDGPAGVISSLEAFRALDLLEKTTEHPLELCILSSEEPNTFGISTFGSRGLVGALEKDALRLLRDEKNNELHSALSFIGGDLDHIEDAVRSPDEIDYFVELHIEQMPYLEQMRKDIGIVQGVTGIYRQAIAIEGIASHCGTTPMADRKDALCAAAEILLALENAAKSEGQRAVATVGHASIYPNSINIVPKLVKMDTEIRSFHPKCIQRIKKKLADTIESIEKARGVCVESQVTYDSPPVSFSPMIINSIRKAADTLGLASMDQISMAGHDAAHVSRIADSGMIFIPSKKGLSHCPEEQTDIEDIVKGAKCLFMTLLILDSMKKGESKCS
jgi:N-carbamoyl-L-amino-acid hydrolase